ncbi:hypothetical protein EAMG_04927 [Escherichia coli M056]|nr:hypothetical protein EAMG_04927 [Escherichia coli M056]
MNQFEFRITQTQNQQASCVFIYATPVSNFMQSASISGEREAELRVVEGVDAG